MADQSLKAQFFVVRPNNVMVPLVALDELPSHINIRNVPRMLTPHQIQGMISVGTYNSRHLYHAVVDMNKTVQLPLPGVHQNGSNASLHATPSIPQAIDGGPTEPTTINVHTATLKVKTENPEVSADGDPAVIAAAKAAGVPVLPQKGKKIYCTHWMRTGECDFTAPGCKFQHIMPFDLPTLDTHGFSDIPKWYREKHGLGSHFTVTGAGQSFGGTPPINRTAAGRSERHTRNHATWRLPRGRDNSPFVFSAAHQTPTHAPVPHRFAPGASPSLYQSKHAPGTGPISSHNKSRANNRSSSIETATKTFCKSPGNSSSRRRGRRELVTMRSECSDYEAEVLHVDAERRAKMDAEYEAIKSGSSPASS